MSSKSELPSIADRVGPLLGRVPAEQHPLLIAIAERLAAERYRDWARTWRRSDQAAALLACADREEEIANRVESLYPEAASLLEEIRAKLPELDDLGRSLFGERPLREQFAIQTRGERAGAATWRAFAKDAEASARRTFLECAELEEQSAAVLDAILDEPRRSGDEAATSARAQSSRTS